MNDHGQAERVCKLELRGKGAPLRPLVRALVVVVQPDLPDGDPLGRGKQARHARKVALGKVGEVGGVQSRGKKQPAVR